MRQTLLRAAACLAALLSVALTWAAPAASAQSINTPADLAPLLAKLDGVDRWYGVYIGSKNVGSFHVTVSRSGSQRTIHTDSSVAVGPFAHRERDDLTVGQQLQPLRYDYSSTEISDQTKSYAGTVVADPSGGASWAETVTNGAGADASTSHESYHLQRFDAGSLTDGAAVLLLGYVDWTHALAQQFFYLDTKSHTDDERTATMAGRVTFDVRGAATQGYEIRTEDLASIGGGALVLHVGASGTLEMLDASGASLSVRMLAGTQAEATNDLAGTAEPPDAASVRRTATSFLKAMATGDAAMLTQTVDFAALQKHLADTEPSVVQLSVDQFRRQLIAGITASVAGVSDQDKAGYASVIDAVSSAFLVSIDGSAAKFAPPDDDHEAITLARGSDGQWHVTWYEQFSQDNGQ